MDEIIETHNDIQYRLTRTGDLYSIEGKTLEGLPASHCKAYVADCYLNGAKIKALALGGLGTEAELRRHGMARQCFKMLGEAADKDDCLVSYLHPFSFTYYRMMGYERVSDHRILEMPISTLNFVPRYPDLIRYRIEHNMDDLAKAYNRFMEGRNGMFYRNKVQANPDKKMCEAYMSNGETFDYYFKNRMYFLCKDEAGEPCGYIRLHKVMDLQHHYLFGTLYVEEIGYDSPETLRKLLGFIRMYDGEVDTVVFTNVGMCPEVELAVRAYKYTKITIVPDIMARVHNIPKLLEVMTYPQEPGSFTIRVTDTEKSPFRNGNTEGTFHVEYADGKAKVTRLAEDADYDMLLPMPAFSQLIHGFESYGILTVRYLEGVEVRRDCPDFFRAFPKRPCGLYDLF